jgi:hypothetical protein|tara:strand:+ start:3151 stop:3588 length:438 start_codon:yes stop_codon:yes gene_type:complete
MSSTPENQADQIHSVILTPSFRLPLLVYVLGLVMLPLPFHPWLTMVVCGIGVFLLLQAYLLRLELTDKDLVIWRSGQELRRFPFANWLAWRMILPGMPGILFFREVNSPHLVPILFDPVMLLDQLRLRVGHLEMPKETKLETSED